MRHGTDWVEPGTGATLAALRVAIGQEPGDCEELIATSLELTGSLLDETDRIRIREVIACPEAHQSRHRVRREGLADGRWVAACSCGWDSEPVLGLPAAKALGRDHVLSDPPVREAVA